MTAQRTQTGTPGVDVFYKGTDLAGNILTSRTNDGVVESASTPGLYFYDQVITLDQFVATWDENDGLATATEVVATKHPVSRPTKPTGVTAVGGNTSATITFTPGDNGGSTVTAYTVTAIDATNTGRGGQTQAATNSPISIGGLTNGDNYTFTVIATNSAGDSPASAASNTVTPAVVLTVPDPPTGVTAAVSGSGQVTVTFTAPVNNGGTAITSYTATAVDETTPGNGGQTHVGNSPSTITSLHNGDAYHFTVHAHNTIGNSAESLQSNTVTPSGSGGIATFTYSQPTNSVLVLDATGSTGTLAWEIDGVPAVATTTQITVGPLQVGSHHVKLTATSGGAGISQQDINVAWVGKPLNIAQHDATNGFAGWWGPLNGPYKVPLSSPVQDGQFSATVLPQWSNLNVLGPWRNISALNMVENYPTAGDNIPRIVPISSNEITLMTKYGDHPGTGGGYRSAMEVISSQSGTGSGYEFASNNLDICGNIGVPSGDGTTGHVRFYRIEMMFPGAATNKMAIGGGTPYSDGKILYQNNAAEMHGNSPGSSPVRFATSGDGSQWFWTFEAKLGGASDTLKQFDAANTLWDTWYSYVIEELLSITPSVGYIRIYRDYGLGAGMQVLPMNRCPTGTKGKTDGTLITDPEYGKLYPTAPYATQQRLADGTPVPQAWDIQNYRTRASIPPDYPDFTIHYRNIRVGPTLASVMI